MLDRITLDEFWNVFLNLLRHWPEDRDLPTTAKDSEALLAMEPELKNAFAGLDEGSQKLARSAITGILKQFSAKIVVKERQEALARFAELVKDRWPQKKEVKPKVRKVVHGVKSREISDYYETICYYDAVLDLLSGQLHRLDPVIGDAGCQWRVPFILDLHGFMNTAVVQEFGGLKAIAPSIEEYRTFRSDLPCGEILRALGQAKIPNSDSYDLAGSDLLQYLADFTKNLKSRCAGFLKIVGVFELALEGFKKDRELDLDFRKYLKLCKLFTTNRVRQMEDVPAGRGIRHPCVLRTFPVTFRLSVASGPAHHHRPAAAYLPCRSRRLGQFRL